MQHWLAANHGQRTAISRPGTIFQIQVITIFNLFLVQAIFYKMARLYGIFPAEATRKQIKDRRLIYLQYIYHAITNVWSVQDWAAYTGGIGRTLGMHGVTLAGRSPSSRKIENWGYVYIIPPTNKPTDLKGW